MPETTWRGLPDPSSGLKLAWKPLQYTN